MSEYVFILGAGASAHAEVPMMAGFLDRMRQLYSPGWPDPWKKLLGPGTRERFKYEEREFADIIPKLRDWYKLPPATTVTKITNR
jgi:hypothetical protein